LQSYSRACFSHLIPPGEEARLFALYSITDKSSSFIGPAVVAVIADQTGFIFLLVAILMPLPLLQRVDMNKGRKDAMHLNSGVLGEDNILEDV
jgi:UMF1 family MFS transporter